MIKFAEIGSEKITSRQRENFKSLKIKVKYKHSDVDYIRRSKANSKEEIAKQLRGEL